MARGFPESGSVEIVTEKLSIAVTFRPDQGYVGTSRDLRQPVIALSLGGLQSKVEAAMMQSPPPVRPTA